MSPLAPTRVMNIADILDLVLCNVEKRHDLAQLVRVNHFWHSLGIRYLWRGQLVLSGMELEPTWVDSVPFTTLFELSKNVARFKQHAQHIKHLNLALPREDNATSEQARNRENQLKQLMGDELWDSCPLTTLRLYPNCGYMKVDCDAALAILLLRPQLRKLFVDVARVTASFLESLKAIPLRWLSVNFFHHEISTQTLQSFLAAQQDLLGLDLHFIETSASKYADSFATMANLPKLRRLRMNMELETVTPLNPDNHHFANFGSLWIAPSCFDGLLAKKFES